MIPKLKTLWTRLRPFVLPSLNITVAMPPLFTVHTDVMYRSFERFMTTYFQLHVTLWKWKWVFDLYETLNSTAMREAARKMHEYNVEMGVLYTKQAKAHDILELINHFRSVEGSSVFIPCDHPDPDDTGETIFVAIQSDWTKPTWQEERFYGRDLLAALQKAKEEEHARRYWNTISADKIAAGHISAAQLSAGEVILGTPAAIVGFPKWASWVVDALVLLVVAAMIYILVFKLLLK
jgi:hypothetical protein